MASLNKKVVLITGSTRGIGREIALKCAQDGAILIITGKTETPHASLPGTLSTVAAEVEAAGGVAFPVHLDVRDENEIRQVVEKVVAEFGKIDVLVNNASAIQLTATEETPMRRFDLMFGVNVRATFAMSQACLPHLVKAENPHILTLSPPLNLDPKWFKDHLAYTMSKYGMSMCTLGLAEEYREKGVGVNSLWPQTTIATMAIKVHFPEAVWRRSRTPAIMADAAYQILTSSAKKNTGNFYIDEQVLRQAGVADFDQYALDPTLTLLPDFFLEEDTL